MDELAVDVPIGEVLRWIREDAARPSPQLLVSAGRSYTRASAADLAEHGIDEEDELDPAGATGLLEIRPRHGPGGWVQQVRVDETVEARPVADEEDEPDDTELTVEAFVDRFVTPAEGEVEIVVLADDEAALNRFDRWLKRMTSPGSRPAGAPR